MDKARITRTAAELALEALAFRQADLERDLDLQEGTVAGRLSVLVAAVEKRDALRDMAEAGRAAVRQMVVEIGDAARPGPDLRDPEAALEIAGGSER